MRSREELHEKLCDILGTRNCYFAPPDSVKMKYPCFVYNYQPFDNKKANDKTYILTSHYELTYISKDPDSGIIPTMLASFEMIRHTTTYMADNLNHDRFDLYY